MTTSVVTGGAGFLGSHLCEYLLAQGHRVICLDNLDTGSLQNIEHLRAEEFEFRNVDLVEFVDLPEDVDLVFHLASPASPIDYLRLPLHTLKVGSYGTHNALGLAKFKRARFLLASTSEVYGDPLQHPQSEDYWGNVNPIGPRGVYDESKRYSEALTMAYHRQQGVDTCIARIFNTYGPRMRPNDGRAVPTFVRQALARQADHGLRRRLADAQLLLRDRPHRRPLPAGHQRASTSRSTSATRARSPWRARRDGGPPHRQQEPGRLLGPAARRPQGATAEHRPGPRDPRLGADHHARRGPQEDARL